MCTWVCIYQSNGVLVAIREDLHEERECRNILEDAISLPIYRQLQVDIPILGA